MKQCDRDSRWWVHVLTVGFFCYILVFAWYDRSNLLQEFNPQSAPLGLIKEVLYLKILSILFLCYVGFLIWVWFSRDKINATYPKIYNIVKVTSLILTTLIIAVVLLSLIMVFCGWIVL